MPLQAMGLQFSALGTITIQGSHKGRFLKWLELMVSTNETTATFLMNTFDSNFWDWYVEKKLGTDKLRM